MYSPYCTHISTISTGVCVRISFAVCVASEFINSKFRQNLQENRVTSSHMIVLLGLYTIYNAVRYTSRLACGAMARCSCTAAAMAACQRRRRPKCKRNGRRCTGCAACARNAQGARVRVREMKWDDGEGRMRGDARMLVKVKSRRKSSQVKVKIDR